MIILIAGASHTGKTQLAQKLLEKYHYPYMSIDHLKMGLIRSFLYGDNSKDYFLECERGVGINKESKLEGMRKNNLICTQMIGPILALNPLLCQYLIKLAGCDATPAHFEAAMTAYKQRVKEFEDPATKF